MNKEAVQSALFDVTITAGQIKVDEKAMSYDQALQLVKKLIADNPDNEFIQDCASKGYTDPGYFGFIGSSYGDNEWHVSAYRERKKVPNEIHTCPRRAESFRQIEEGKDTWEIRGDDKCCSYCGSIHPERVLELIRIHGFGIIGSTDKGYKFYVTRDTVPNAGFGGIKFYVQHFSQDQIDEYNQLVKAHKQSRK